MSPLKAKNSCFAGVVRTVTNATTLERKQWDKETGIFLQSIDTLPGYTINATATKTNIVGSSSFGGLDETVFFAAFIVAGMVVVAVVLVMLRKKGIAGLIGALKGFFKHSAASREYT